MWSRDGVAQWAMEHDVPVEDVCVVQVKNVETGEVSFRYAKLPWYYRMDRDINARTYDGPWGSDGFWLDGRLGDWEGGNK